MNREIVQVELEVNRSELVLEYKENMKQAVD